MLLHRKELRTIKILNNSPALLKFRITNFTFDIVLEDCNPICSIPNPRLLHIPQHRQPSHKVGKYQQDIGTSNKIR